MRRILRHHRSSRPEPRDRAPRRRARGRRCVCHHIDVVVVALWRRLSRPAGASHLGGVKYVDHDSVQSWDRTERQRLNGGAATTAALGVRHLAQRTSLVWWAVVQCGACVGGRARQTAERCGRCHVTRGKTTHRRNVSRCLGARHGRAPPSEEGRHVVGWATWVQ
jgi:hypothetical protein